MKKIESTCKNTNEGRLWLKKKYSLVQKIIYRLERLINKVGPNARPQILSLTSYERVLLNTFSNKLSE